MNKIKMPNSLLLVCLALLLSANGAEGPPVQSADTSDDPLAEIAEGILGLFDEADMVCLGERHGRQQDFELWLSLFRHPEFYKIVNAISVEFANATHQRLMDRFLVEGDEIPLAEFRWVWRDTGYRTWDAPIYEKFFLAARKMNLRLPRQQRVRILAADTPLDWSKIDTWQDFPEFIDRGSFPAKVLDEEVLSKGLKGLAIQGRSHCQQGFTRELEQKYPGRVRVVLPVGAGEKHSKLLRSALSLGEEPAWIYIRTSPIAGHPVLDYLPGLGFNLGYLRQEHLFGKKKLAEIVDAFIYLGGLPDPPVTADPRVFQEETYARELKRRGKIWSDWSREQRKRQRLNPPED